eukprot:ctg_274.g111
MRSACSATRRRPGCVVRQPKHAAPGAARKICLPSGGLARIDREDYRRSLDRVVVLKQMQNSSSGNPRRGRHGYAGRGMPCGMANAMRSRLNTQMLDCARLLVFRTAFVQVRPSTAGCAVTNTPTRNAVRGLGCGVGIPVAAARCTATRTPYATDCPSLGGLCQLHTAMILLVSLYVEKSNNTSDSRHPLHRASSVA